MAKKIRLVHLSDFHLNSQTLRDWNSFLKPALIEKLTELKDDSGFDLVGFTGDLLDKGGKDFEDIDKAFDIFNKEVICPLIKTLDIRKDKFFIIPGNHDIERSKDSIIVETGLRGELNQRDKVSDFIGTKLKNLEDDEGIKRIKAYTKFEDQHFSETNHLSLKTRFSSSFIIDGPEGTKIGVSCLNSAWRCYDDSDDGRILIGEHHLADHCNFIESSDLKIALIHHPLNMLSAVEEDTILNHIQKEFDLILYGHSHKGDTLIRLGFTGTLFQNMAPSGLNNISSDSRMHSNGFTLIEVDLESRKICADYWRYSNSKKKFVKNTDLGYEDGKFCGEIPKEIPKKKMDDIHMSLDVIREVHYPQMNEHLIEIKNNKGTIKSLDENYILPPISVPQSRDDESENEQNISLSEIVQSPWNLIFFGNSESGKTILLYRLVYEFVEEFNSVEKIPIYLDFEEMGNKGIETIIREYLQTKAEHVKYLLKENKLVLLVDNLNYKKYNLYKDRFKKLERFIHDNKSILILATSENELSSLAPIEFLENCSIPFSELFIQNLGSKEIKNIMKLWIPNGDSLEIEQRLENMVKNFQSFSLPSTAMSVSLFLWSTENHDRKPINHAVLLEIYLEIILQKLDKWNIYRDTFDFTNKVQILAKIAHEMLDTGNDDSYSLSSSQYEAVIERYLKSDVAFDYDSSIIAEYFLNRKIFVRKGNRVKFFYSCFFNFFLAKRMQFNKDFRKRALSEEEYYKHYKEIDLYTGLVRSDQELLEKIFMRFKEEFSRTDFIIEEMKGKWDKHFILELKEEKEEKSEFVSIAKNISLMNIQESRPSQVLIDEFNDKRLAKVKDPHTILRKEGSINLEILLIIMSNVLRNSETVEDKKLKRDVYNTIIKYSMVWMILYREYIIDFVIKNKKLPPAIPAEANLINVLKDLPLHVQLGMNKHMGTFKLTTTILDKIKDDQKGRSMTDSNLEEFLSVALYSDIQGRNYPKYFKKLIKRLDNNPIRDYSFYKLIDYYFRRTKPGSPNEDIYLDLLAELRIRSQGLPARYRDRIIKTFKDSKKKYLN